LLKGKELKICDSLGNVIYKEIVDSSRWEGVIATALSLHAANILSQAVGSTAKAVDILETEWRSSNPAIGIRGHVGFADTIGFSHEIEAIDGVVRWNRFCGTERWPTDQELIDSQNEFLESYQLTSALVAYLAKEGLNSEVDDGTIFIGPLAVRPLARTLRISTVAKDKTEFAKIAKAMAQIDAFFQSQSIGLGSSSVTTQGMDFELDLV